MLATAFLSALSGRVLPIAFFTCSISKDVIKVGRYQGDLHWYLLDAFLSEADENLIEN